MSIINRIPPRGLPFETSNRFSSTFNVPTLGRYDFDIAANQNQLVATLNPNNVYYIDRVSFSASIDEGVFLEAVDTLPTARLRWSLSKNVGVFPQPLPAINYRDGLEYAFWFWSPKQGNNLLISTEGTLTQPPPIVGLTNVFLQLSFVIYEVGDSETVTTIKKGLLPGEFYRRV